VRVPRCRAALYAERVNRRTAAPALLSAVVFPLAAVVFVLACSKPPKTSVDVDTMREAAFVDAPPEDAGVKRPTVVIASADEGTPAMNGIDGTPSPSASSRAEPTPPKNRPKGREKISRAECSRMFEHLFDVTLKSDPRFADLGDEGKAAVRQIVGGDPRLASFQKDCEFEVSRAKYTCAMAAKTASAWQDCVK
jgi:hypothetical protein